MDGKRNEIVDKSFEFAVRIVRLRQYLVKTHKEFVLSKQILRSGTSIGANVNEAQAAQSKADFVAKMSVASKESRETSYWLQLLCESDYLDRIKSQVQALIGQNNELIKLLTRIVKTAQSSTQR